MLIHRRGEQPGHSPTQRIESFSDGVFSVAITLLILEIKIPRVSSFSHDLGRSLIGLWPAYFAYVFSFVTVGIYWVNHHYVFKLYKRTDHIFDLLNIFFLMWISFVPLPTAVLAEYVLVPTERHAAIIFYNLGLLLPALGWALMWLYASRGLRLIDARLHPAFVRHLTLRYVASVLVYLASLGAACWNATLGLSLSLALTFLYLMPSKKPYYREEEPE